MNRIEDIEKRAASQSMNKWIGRLEEEFDLEAEGSTPTERMEDINGATEAAIGWQ